MKEGSVIFVDMAEKLSKISGLDSGKNLIDGYYKGERDISVKWEKCLFEAVRKGNSSQIKALVELRPDIILDELREESKSLLHVAVENGNIEAIKTLVRDMGINIEDKDDMGRTPIFYTSDKIGNRFTDYLTG